MSSSGGRSGGGTGGGNSSRSKSPLSSFWILASGFWLLASGFWVLTPGLSHPLSYGEFLLSLLRVGLPPHLPSLRAVRAFFSSLTIRREKMTPSFVQENTPADSSSRASRGSVRTALLPTPRAGTGSDGSGLSTVDPDGGRGARRLATSTMERGEGAPALPTG